MTEPLGRPEECEWHDDWLLALPNEGGWPGSIPCSHCQWCYRDPTAADD